MSWVSSPPSKISRADRRGQAEGTLLLVAGRLRGQRHHQAPDIAQIPCEAHGWDGDIVDVEIGQRAGRHARGEGLESRAQPRVLEDRVDVVPDEANELGSTHLNALRIRHRHPGGPDIDHGAGRGGHGDRRKLVGVDEIDDVARRETRGIRDVERRVVDIGVGGERRRGAGEIGPEADAGWRRRGDLHGGGREARTGQLEVFLHDQAGSSGLLCLSATVAVLVDLNARGEDAAHPGQHHAENAAGDEELGQAEPSTVAQVHGAAERNHGPAERDHGPAERDHGMVTWPEGCTVTVSELPLPWETVRMPDVLAVPNAVNTAAGPVRVTSLESAIIPVALVSGPTHAAPAQVPWRSWKPPATVWTQMFWRVVMATMRAWLRIARISRAPPLAAAAGR